MHLFEGLKKKKKKSTLKETEGGDGEGNAEEFDFGEKKKKKKKPKAPVEEENEGEDSSAAQQTEHVTEAVGEEPFTYQQLLTRVFDILRTKNPDLSADKKKSPIVPPQVLREGSKKTAFANIVDICKRMKRAPDHVVSFLFAELGTTGSIDGSARLIIKGRFMQKQIENVLKRYIGEFLFWLNRG